MRVLMLPAAAAILLIGADLLCAPAANAQVQSPSPGATAQPSNIPDQKLDAAAAAVERVTTLTQDYQQRITTAAPADAAGRGQPLRGRPCSLNVAARYGVTRAWLAAAPA